MNTFVATIDLALAPKLQEDLESQGFVLTKPPYTLFSANKPGVSCTLYTSGKITVQGKGKDEFISFYLEPEILKNVSYSYPEVSVDLTPHIGVDEAGKGDFFGPLCIGAVYADENGIKELLKLGVKDSKEMSDKTMLALAPKIRAATAATVIRISPLKYNEMYQSFQNLNRLLAWGHATAIAELVQKTGCQKALIDQFAKESLVEAALAKKGIRIDLTQRPKAEEDPVVAAASIMARAAFVDGIDALSKDVGLTLPKGASSLVIAAGRKLVQKEGRSILEKVGKLHFKTAQEILSQQI
ncbi:MAG: ribonuclease HIII [Rhabdochlamydiaceae bacterium]|nr:ribonuclease HIII [Rhabdochlamydiaceae bacterium]